MDRVPILYDEECRFCRAALGLVLAWDGERRLRPVAIQSQEGDRLLAEIPEYERLLSAHAVLPGDAGLISGGAAGGPLLRLLPGGTPLALLLERTPRATDRSYRWVAENRVRLSRLVPVTLKDRADAIITARSTSEAPRRG